LAFVIESGDCTAETEGALHLIERHAHDLQKKVYKLQARYDALREISGVKGSTGNQNYDPSGNHWSAFDPCPHCGGKTGYSVKPRMPIGKIDRQGMAVYKCNDCAWRWWIDDDGTLKLIEDRISF
jgi:DNA-directed RNA polymerase subunit RPC12/RpoP